MNARVLRLREWGTRLLTPSPHPGGEAATKEPTDPRSAPRAASASWRHAWKSLPIALCITAVPAAYALLDGLHVLAPALRDRPWPFEAAGVALALALARSTVGRRTSSAGALKAVLPTVAVVAGVIALSVFARGPHQRLPAAPPELLARTTLPAFVARDSSGRRVTNASLIGSPTVVVVYRGAWCPYCRKQLAVLADEARRFASTPVKVVAVSPDPPAKLAELEDSLEIPYTLLSDSEQNLASLCVSSSHCVLVADRKGTLRWGAFTDNWREPPRYGAILQAAYRLAD
jgi:peroxiredoxin